MIWVLTVAWLPVDAQLEAWMTSTLERTLRVGTLLTTAAIVVQAFINIFKKSIENITDNFSQLSSIKLIPDTADNHGTSYYQPNSTFSQFITHPHSASGQLTTCIHGNIHTLCYHCCWCMYVHSLHFCFCRDQSLNNIHIVLIKHTSIKSNSKDLFNIEFSATKL